MPQRRLPKRSILDAGDLPVGEIAHIARREGIRPRAAYQAHKWFARRLAATARSLLVAATAPEGTDFWTAYYGGGSCEGLTVLDPFMGGGVMLLEAARLGADVLGVDVEPVAAVVSDFQGRLPQLPTLSPEMERLRASAGAELAPFYRAVDADGREERLLHAFWVQVLACAACQTRFDAHPSFRLAWDDVRQREWVVCACCSGVSERTVSREGFVCRGCGTATDPAGGHLDHGTAVCPVCRHRQRLIDLAAHTGRPPEFRLFAVETIPTGPERRYTGASRRIRTSSDEDQRAYAEAEQRLQQELKADPAFLAVGQIPRDGRSDDRLLRYGYTDYAQLHGARQSLHLGLLARSIAQIGGAAGEALRIAFSDHVATNNLLCAYAGGWRRLAPLFSIRAYRHIARPVEVNPWLERNGRGTFPNAVRAVERAARWLKDEREPTVDSGMRQVRSYPKPMRWDVRCGDARDLAHIPSASVDLVLTDPPYFDYIAYSELGHFFVPWLARLGLVDASHLDAFPEGQLASLRGTVMAAKAFEERLAEALREVARVCKPQDWVVFTYQNLNGRGWSALGTALAAAGIRPIRAWPMFGDSSAGLHKHANSVSWDCAVVCEIGKEGRDVALGEEDRCAGEAFAAAWVERLTRTGHEVTPGDRANFAHAGAMLSAFASAKGPPRAQYRPHAWTCDKLHSKRAGALQPRQRRPRTRAGQQGSGCDDGSRA